MRLIITLCLLSSLAWSQPEYTPTGAPRSVTVDDFYKHPTVGDGYNETWRYNMTFTNGTKMFLNYTFMQVPLQGTKCGTNVSIYNFNGKNYQIGRQYPKERFKQNKKEQKIIVKNGSGPDNVFFMAGKPGNGHSVMFKTSKGEGYSIDLSFSNATQGAVKGDGIFKLHEQSVGLFIHMPHATVSGTITVDGKTQKVEGHAYMEQIWQSSMSTDIVSHGIQFYGPQSPVLGNVIIGSKNLKSQPFGYLIDPKDGSLLFPKKVVSRNLEIKYDHKPLSNPTITVYNSKITYTNSANSNQQKYSVLSTIDGWFAKKAAKVAMGGEAFFYRGAGKLNNNPIDYNIFYLDD